VAARADYGKNRLSSNIIHQKVKKLAHLSNLHCVRPPALASSCCVATHKKRPLQPSPPKNLPTGQVELVVEGDPVELEAYRQAVRDSGLQSFIHDEKVAWMDALGDFKGFEIVR
jgi:hypothetical protein